MFTLLYFDAPIIAQILVPTILMFYIANNCYHVTDIKSQKLLCLMFISILCIKQFLMLLYVNITISLTGSLATRSNLNLSIFVGCFRYFALLFVLLYLFCFVSVKSLVVLLTSKVRALIKTY